MATIEYSKLYDEFLLTDHKKNRIGENEIYFVGEKDGTLYIQEKPFKLNGGRATVNASDLSDGLYTPILKTADASFICDKISVEAGVIKPVVNSEKRARYLTKQIICEHRRLMDAEEKISRLCDAVYGKSIL